MGNFNQYSATASISLAGCELYPATRSLVIDDHAIYLRNKLWLVLYRLASQMNQIVTRSDLIELAWNGNCYTGEAGLTHTVCHLRRILRLHKVNAEILTIPKYGYVLRAVSHAEIASHLPKRRSKRHSSEMQARAI